MTTDESPPIPEPAIDPGPHSEDGLVTAPEAADLPAVRALILAAHPDVVPDLVAGTTVAALLASVEGARAAYAAVEARLAPRPAAPGAVPLVIPAGGGAPLPIDPDRLPASEKIRRGLRAIPAASGELR